MKNKKFLLLPILTAVMLLLATPAHAMHLLFHPGTPIPVLTTNYVINVTTNVATGVTSTVTNQEVKTVEVPQYTLAPTLTTGLATGQTVSGFLPPPYDLVVSGALTALGTILGIALKKKNGQLSTTQTVLQSVITGVEAVGDANTKLSIQSHANAAGVEPVLQPLVQSVTANAPGPIIPAPAK